MIPTKDPLAHAVAARPPRFAGAVAAASTRKQKRVRSPDPFYLRELQTRFFDRKEAVVADLLEFFGADAAQLATLTLEVNVLDLLMAQRALQHLLPGWRVVRECRYDSDVATMVKRLAVAVAPDEHDFVIRFGRQFLLGPEGERLAVDYYADDDRRVEESEVTFTLPASRHAWLRALMPRLREWSDRNHFLRGKAITAEGRFIRFAQAAAWEDVIMAPALREALQRNCVDLLGHAPLFRANGVPLRRGIVLHGPPGTGKTMIGRALAQRCGVTFILATPGMLKEPVDVRRIFAWGRRFAPAILFFEDFDLVAGNRHGYCRRDIVGEFLSCLDGLDARNGIIAIATTNDLTAIEPAMKERPNRFDCVLEVPALDTGQRVEFLQRWNAQATEGNIAAPPENPDVAEGDTAEVAFLAPVEHGYDIQRVADRTPGFTGAQLQELCRLAVFEAVEERIRSGETKPERLPLTDAHFDAALKRQGVRRRQTVGFNAAE